MKRRILVILAALLALSSFADERLEPMDFYIVYDRSLSMRLDGKAEDSKNWLISSFIGPVVIPGDKVFLISFYRKAETVWDGPVKDDADKKDLMRKITALKPNGNALDALKTRLETSLSDSRKKYIILLTDEIQEAPPGSPYFSKDGRFAHAYLTYVRREAHGPWKVITIGVGIGDKVESSVKELESVITALPAERLKDADPRLIHTLALIPPDSGSRRPRGPRPGDCPPRAKTGTIPRGKKRERRRRRPWRYKTRLSSSGITRTSS
jgi:hypothetical protein